MKVRIDKALCTGNARCWTVAPILDLLDVAGYIATQGFDFSPSQEELARRARLP